MPVFAAEALDLVQIGVRRGASLEFARGLQALGLAPPEAGLVSSAHGLDLLWLQPNTYLLVAPRGAMPSLQSLAPYAALVEQSSGRAAFTLSGPKAIDVLGKGCRLDFHPRSFGTGRVASSSLAHVNAVIQHLAHAPLVAASAGVAPSLPHDGDPAFRIIVFSSFAQHVAEFLAHAMEAA